VQTESLAEEALEVVLVEPKADAPSAADTGER
jgi:hypothetical protein